MKSVVQLRGKVAVPDAERGRLHIAHVGGTAWAKTNRHLVTSAHVVRGLRLNAYPQELTITHVSPSMEILTEVVDARVFEYANVRVPVGAVFEYEHVYANDLAVLELSKSLPWLRPLRTTVRVPEHGMRMVTMGFPSWRWTSAHGTSYGHVHPDYGFKPTLVFAEVSSDGNRWIMGAGASGSPLLDCRGHVYATIAGQFYETRRITSAALGFFDGVFVRTPPAIGKPTNVAVIPSEQSFIHLRGGALSSAARSEWRR